MESIGISPLKAKFNPFLSLPPFLCVIFSVKVAIMIAASGSLSEPESLANHI